MLIVFDLVNVDWRYVNTENFMSARLVEQPFQATPADKEILKDTTRYRVYEQSIGLNGARTSYFHNSIGGYHGAKPARLQDLIEFYLYEGNLVPLNLLNTKYIITQNEEGQEQVQVNSQAAGNVWFVQNVKIVPDADAEIQALDSINVRQTAVIQQEFAGSLDRTVFPQDSTQSIKLVEHRGDYLKYLSNAKSEKLAVFSEVYYPNGWQAYIDGQPTDYFKVDYILRGMKVPSGKHTIEFKFEPQVVRTGSTISLASNVILVLLLLGALAFSIKRSRETKA